MPQAIINTITSSIIEFLQVFVYCMFIIARGMRHSTHEESAWPVTMAVSVALGSKVVRHCTVDF